MKKLLQYCVILLILTMWSTGFFFTLFGIRIPFLWHLQRFGYETMSMYQQYYPVVEEYVLEAEHSPNSWERIPLDRYLPLTIDEQYIRMQLLTFKGKGGEQLQAQKYREMAAMILQREQARGNPARRIRISKHSWPKSPAGHAYLREEPYITTVILAETP